MHRKDKLVLSRNLKFTVDRGLTQGQNGSTAALPILGSSCPESVKWGGPGEAGKEEAWPLRSGRSSRRKLGPRGLEGAGTKREEVRMRNRSEKGCCHGTGAGSVRSLGSCCSFFLACHQLKSLRVGDLGDDLSDVFYHSTCPLITHLSKPLSHHLT